MPRYSARDQSAIRDLESSLSVVSDGAAPTLAALVAGLTSLLETAQGMAGAFGPRGDGVCLTEGYTVGLEGFPAAMDAWLSGKPIGWTAYHPLRPEPAQRNRVLSLQEIYALPGHRGEDEPLVREVYPKFGLVRLDHLRVLICEGPSLLAWVGFSQPSAFDTRQRRLLARIRPAIARRLGLERRVHNGGATRALLDAALGVLSAPAFILRTNGEVAEANGPGERCLERDPTAVREGLRRAVRFAPASPDYDLTAVQSAGRPNYWLAIARPDAERVARARRAAARFRLTPTEGEVLQRVIEGISNRTIAAELAVAERTVEGHLTSMYEKAQVESRTQLVRKVLG